MDSSSSFCPRCGALNTPDAVNCFACGHSCSAEAAPTQGPGTAAPLLKAGMLAPGVLLRQRYSILGRIGEGGFGAVYRAEDTQLHNRLVAIKEMGQQNLKSGQLEEATEAFHQEALLLAGLAHPSLPRIYDHFNEQGNWYLVMDFIEGKSLEAYLTQHGGRLPVQEVLQLGIKLCRVLEYLHFHQPPIIFRDLKPANIMLEPGGQVVLIDFGIARLFKPGKAHDTVAFGSTGYAAPEQYGKAQTTPRADIYSLGALLHQMLSGYDPSETPFRFASLQVPVPAGMWELLQRMAHMDEAQRPETIAAVRRELERLEYAWAKDTQPTPIASASLAPPQTRRPLPAPTKRASVVAGRKKKSAWRYAWVLVMAFPWLIQAINHSSSTQYSSPDTGNAGLAVDAAIWSPDGQYLAEAVGTEVEVRDGTTGQVIQTYEQADTNPDWLAWSPDSTKIASANNDGTAEVWEVATGKTIATFRGQTQRVSELSWSPDGTRVVSSSDDGSVQVWDAATGKTLFTYQQHTNKVWTVAWSPDGKRIASGGADKTGQIWDATTGKTLLVYQGHTDGIGHLSWSADSTRIASASQDGTVRVWDATTGATLATYGNHASNANAVAWSPDMLYLASASSDDLVEIWSATTAQEIFISNASSSTVWSVSWSKDNRIAVAGSDGTVHIWDALTGNNEVTYQG